MMGTDLDWLPPADQSLVVLTPRKCRHPRYKRLFLGGGAWMCDKELGGCGLVVGAEKARLGKSSRRLGGDQERRIERVYGPVKIGERGDPVDHIGRVWRWQSKATRALPPLWLSPLAEPTWRQTIPVALTTPYWRMAGKYGGRCSVVIRSFVANGLRTRDWLFISQVDATGQFGLPVLGEFDGWWVIPGDWWLDHFGRDE